MDIEISSCGADDHTFKAGVFFYRDNSRDGGEMHVHITGGYNIRKMTSSVADYENLMTSGFTDSNNAFRSGVRPRWERKQMQKSIQASSSNSCCSESGSCSKSDLSIGRKPFGIHVNNSQTLSRTGDRFIPNQTAMDMEMSAHNLRKSASSSKEDEDPAMDNNNIARDAEEFRSMLS